MKRFRYTARKGPGIFMTKRTSDRWRVLAAVSVVVALFALPVGAEPRMTALAGGNVLLVEEHAACSALAWINLSTLIYPMGKSGRPGTLRGTQFPGDSFVHSVPRSQSKLVWPRWTIFDSGGSTSWVKGGMALELAGQRFFAIRMAAQDENAGSPPEYSQIYLMTDAEAQSLLRQVFSPQNYLPGSRWLFDPLVERSLKPPADLVSPVPPGAEKLAGDWKRAAPSDQQQTIWLYDGQPLILTYRYFFDGEARQTFALFAITDDLKLGHLLCAVAK